MRAKLLPLAIALVAVAVATAVAIAKTHQDPDDTKGKIDIKSAKFSKTDDGKFKFVVNFYEKVPAKGETGNEYLEIWKKKPDVMPNCNGCFKQAPFKMQGPQTGKRDVYKGGEADTPYKKTGSGNIKRDGKTLTFTLPPKAVGKPEDKFFWRIHSYYYGTDVDCQGPCEDRLPDGTKLIKQEL